MPRTPREMEILILADGWKYVRTRGSHKHYKHPQKQGVVTIPWHGNKTLAIGTERNILKQAGLK